jgi:threonyl-tRNA synthetase
LVNGLLVYWAFCTTHSLGLGGEPVSKQAYEETRLYRLRHSAAHLMAQALTELFPGVKLAIGPPVENGFYYDVDPPRPIKEEDFAAIEARMRELAALDQPIVRRVAGDREEARRIVLDECTLGQGEDTALYKLELLEALPPDEEVSFYDQQRNGRRFIDLCRGPHIERTGEIEHFKLMSIAGAYWRGDVRNKQLTRLYGTAFESATELDLYLHNLEEAKKRYHGTLGKELGLFIFSPRVGPGLPLWLPKGTVLRDTLCDFLKEEQLRRGYQGVVTPQIASRRLYEKSGHILTFKEKMFPFMEDGENETFILKPMNCPFHIEIYSSAMRSYRDLPVRLAEFGTVYRYEQSGELAGMLRVRGFTQDDAHLFVTPSQLLDEFKGVVGLMMTVLRKLGLTEYRVRLGVRDDDDEKYVGHQENWELAQRSIEQACIELGLDYEVSVGDAAFYGPKLDLIIKDALGREWQMGTVQVDYNLPERFDLEYIAEDGKPHRPIMIHRAPFGSLERMIGLLTEQYAGAFPFWLAPVQVAMLPIADRHVPYARAIAEALQGFRPNDWDQAERGDWPELAAPGGARYRVEVDDRRETLGKKIREHQHQKTPYMLIVGDRDQDAGTAGVRSREKGDLGAMPLAEVCALLARESGDGLLDR